MGATRRRMGEEGERLVELLLRRHCERAILVRRHQHVWHGAVELGRRQCDPVALVRLGRRHVGDEGRWWRIGRHGRGRGTRGHTPTAVAVLDGAGVHALPAAAAAASTLRLTPRLVAVVRAARTPTLGEGTVVGQHDNGRAVVQRARVDRVCLGERGRGREVDLGLLRRVGQCAVEAGVGALLCGGTLEDGAWRHGFKVELVCWRGRG